MRSRPMRKAGFDTFDMADHYGSAELITGRLLARYRRRDKRPVAFTKWCPEPGPMTAEIVRKGVQERLDRLGVDRVDLLQFHWWTFEHPAWLDALHEMARLREEGLIGAIGVTNFDAAHLALALADGVPVATNQVSFSLVDRRAAGALSALCREKGVKLLAYGTLCGGFLSDKWLGQPEPDEHRRLEPLQIQALHRCGRRLGGVPGHPAALPARSPQSMASRSPTSRRAGCWSTRRSPRRSSARASARASIAPTISRSSASPSMPRTRRCSTQAFAGDHADPRRLRRRIPPAALSHRVGRSQPPSRCDPVGLHGRAGAGPAGPPARLLGQRLGADRRLQPRRAGQGHDPRFRHDGHAWRRPLRRAGRSRRADHLHPRQDRRLDHRARRQDGGRRAHPHLSARRREMGAGVARPRPRVRRRSSPPTRWSRPAT